MLIKNISDKNLQIPASVGKEKTFILEPGKIAYIEDKRSKDNQIIIWRKKQIIEVKEVNKPEKLQYDTPYSTTKQLNIAPIATIVDVDDDDDEDNEVMSEFPPAEITGGDGKEEDEEVFDEQQKEEDSTAEPIKNKGGRPKGVKNKKKKKNKKKSPPAVKNISNPSDSETE